MSKEKKEKQNAESMRRWRTGQLNKNERKAMEALGLDTADYGWQRSDRGSDNAGDYDDMRRDFMAAAGNNYDMRRSMEAMAMSGKGKAEKIAEKGFKSAGDVMNAFNMMGKAHARNNNGGDFSSANDFAGVTYNAVQRDRKVLNKDIDSRISTATDELREEMKSAEVEPQWDDAKDSEVELSPDMQAAKDRAKSWGSSVDSTVNPYGDDQQDDSAVIAADTTTPAADDAGDGKKYAAGQSYLSKFKDDLRAKGKFVSNI